MPGSARRVRPAYSRTLCLPCLKAGIFCFLHYRYHCLYVQLFIFNFLCICLLLFGTSFFSRSSFKSVLPVAFYRCRPNLHGGLTRLQQGWSVASLVSFPYLSPKVAHRLSQGQVWFLLTRWHFSERISGSFSELSCKNSGRKKIPLPHFSEMEPVKSVIPCKRFFKPSGVKAFSLFMRRRFCAAKGGLQNISSTVFSHTNSEPGLSWAGF